MLLHCAGLLVSEKVQFLFPNWHVGNLVYLGGIIRLFNLPGGSFQVFPYGTFLVLFCRSYFLYRCSYAHTSKDSPSPVCVYFLVKIIFCEYLLNLLITNEFMNLLTKNSRICETKHLSTDANSSTDTTIGWTKNTQKPNFFEKRKKSSKTQKLQNV